LGLCSYGLNYYRLDENLLIAGIALRDFPGDTPARRKMLKLHRRDLVDRAHLDRFVAFYRRELARSMEDDARRREADVRDYRHSQAYIEEILARLQPELRREVANVHDYKQFVRQIIQNLDVLLERRFPNRPLVDKIESAEAEEAAIYWAAQMMDGKLDAVGFLEQPERIKEFGEFEVFRLDLLVNRYVQIYRRFADKRQIQLRIHDQSNGEIAGNARALRVIPHTLIDNAITYAPSGSEIEMVLRQDGLTLLFTIRSLGPRIDDHEVDAIFDPFFRGAAAKLRRVEGSGFGLAAAQAIAVAHKTRIQVIQAPDRLDGDNYQTTFSIPFTIQ
jgi:signal transduction histidine kinase